MARGDEMFNRTGGFFLGMTPGCFRASFTAGGAGVFLSGACIALHGAGVCTPCRMRAVKRR